MQNFIEGIENTDVKDISILSQILLTLSSHIARSANLVAEAGMIASTAKRKAYLNFSDVAKAQGLDFSASIVKDFVLTQCGEEMRCYEFADRINSSLVHSLDALRSILSAAKTEWATVHYQT